MSIETQALFRWIKPEKRLKPLVPRTPSLTAATFNAASPVVLDTNIYILNGSGRLSADGARIVDQSLLFHCSVCVAELMTGVGNRSPKSPDWKAMRDHYRGIVEAIQTTRLLVPDQDVWAEAGLVAGVLSRTQNFQPHQRKECLNDALVYLTAAKAGLPVLTNDAQDFDLIEQVCGRGAYIAV